MSSEKWFVESGFWNRLFGRLKSHPRKVVFRKRFLDFTFGGQLFWRSKSDFRKTAFRFHFLAAQKSFLKSCFQKVVFGKWFGSETHRKLIFGFDFWPLEGRFPSWISPFLGVKSEKSVLVDR